MSTSTTSTTTKTWNGLKYKKLPTTYHTTSTRGARIAHATREVAVVQYNILAGNLATTQHFPYVPSILLSWNTRRQRLIDMMTHVNQSDVPTIICCEELNSYWTYFQPELHKRGYRSVYLKRPNTHVSNWSGLDKYDGCMIAFKEDTWDLLEVESVYYSDDHDRIALILLLKWKQEWEEDVAHHYSPYLIVGCTHLYWNSQRLDIQLTELHHFQYALHRFRCRQQSILNDTRIIPTIVCGDFNNGPNSEVYQHMTCQDQDLLRSYTQRPPTVTRVLKQAAAESTATSSSTSTATSTSTSTSTSSSIPETSTSSDSAASTSTSTSASTSTSEIPTSSDSTSSTSSSPSPSTDASSDASSLLPSRPSIADTAQHELDAPDPYAMIPRYVFRSAYAQYGCLTSTPPASSSSWTSPYQFFEPAFTSLTPRRCWTIDYIFYNQDAIRPTHLLVLPEKQQLQQENNQYRQQNGLPPLPLDTSQTGVDLSAAIPNHVHPSDHFPIAACFQLVPQLTDIENDST